MEEEIERLKALLAEKDKEIEKLRNEAATPSDVQAYTDVPTLSPLEKKKLSNEDIARYSRQLILPEI